MSQYQNFEVQHHVDVTMVHLLDHQVLDPGQIKNLTDELRALVDTEHTKKLLVNFGSVTRCSSEVLGALIVLWKHVAGEGGQMRLCGMNDNIREVFRITRLEDRVFDIYDSAAEALRGF